jgi:hypothetical protein
MGLLRRVSNPSQQRAAVVEQRPYSPFDYFHLSIAIFVNAPAKTCEPCYIALIRRTLAVILLPRGAAPVP